MAHPQHPHALRHYPCHRPRLFVRLILLPFLIIAFCLYIADGASCVRTINKGNNEPNLSGAHVNAQRLCWHGATWGDIRPVIIVKQPPSRVCSKTSP
jgi:hypothetical protein